VKVDSGNFTKTMSSIANIVAFDGAATPVTHTFVAASVVREGNVIIASYKESLAGVPDYAQTTVTIKKNRLGSGVTRVSTRVEVPVMEAILNQNAAGYTAAPKVAYIDTVEVVGFYHDRSLIAGRRSSRQLALNIANSISTSVTPVTTGPVPEAFDQLVMPT
jgi:hypothetical protein